MRDSMNHCLQKQPSTPHLPLPDYVDSAAVLEETDLDGVQAG